MTDASPSDISVLLDQRAFSAARVYAAARYPYLAAALFALAISPAPESTTISIDEEWQIHADPAIAAELDTPELARLLVHLLSHVLRDHAARATRAEAADGPDSAASWNRAADAEINDDLAADEMVPRCAPDLPATFGAEDGALAEEYYRGVGAQDRRWDCGSGCDGVPRPWDRGQDRIGKRDAQWLRLATAAELQRSEGLEPGSVPAGWLRWAETVAPSKTDWRRVLAAEVRAGVARAVGMVDYSYRRLSRRGDQALPVVLPALDRPIPDVAIVCDTSGSMSGDLLGRALVEIEALLNQSGLRHTHVRVLACDANVQAVRRVSQASQIELVGGGGTDMGQGIRQAVLLRPRPSIIVVLTDGFTPWPEVPPSGVRVIVGLLDTGPRTPGLMSRIPAPPDWARSIHISV